MKKIAIVFILIGIAFLSVGGYQYFRLQAMERESYLAAQELIENSPQRNKDAKNAELAAFEPEQGDIIGILEMESIDGSFPIVEGTDDEDLDKGVGHFINSAFPGENDQIVLSGHRDTVFRRLGEVEIGDTFTLKLPYGDFTYEMVDYKIVDKDDRTVITSTAPNEELILTTCYPFSFVGSAPERYVVYAVPVEGEVSDEKESTND